MSRSYFLGGFSVPSVDGLNPWVLNASKIFKVRQLRRSVYTPQASQDEEFDDYFDDAHALRLQTDFIKTPHLSIPNTHPHALP